MNFGVGIDWCGWACSRLCGQVSHPVFCMSISKNGRWPSSLSMVNCMFLWIPFKWFRNSQSFCFPCGQMTKVSPTCLNQHIGLCGACSLALFSQSSVKKLAITGESGEPIATLSICS